MLPGEQPFVLEPFGDGCQAACGRRDHVVVGVSPGNSYFGVEVLARLLRWLSGEFRRIDVVVPDSALVHTYLALGYPPEKAERKARAETSVLRNRVLRGWHAGGGPRSGDGVSLMSSLAVRDGYRTLLQRAEDALAQDPLLHDTAARMTRHVLRARSEGREPSPAQLAEGIRYLAAELPFFLSSPDIFDVPSSVCVYHQDVPLAGVIFGGRSLLRPSPRQGYALFRPADAAHSAGSADRRPERSMV